MPFVVCPCILLSLHLASISQYSFEHLLHGRIQNILSELMRGSKTFCQRGDQVLSRVDEGREDPNSTQRNAIEMTFRWWANDGPALNAGLVALYFFVLLRNPLFL